MTTGEFYAFSTIVTLQAFAQEEFFTEVFLEVKALCHVYERLFSRTLPHSDIAMLNAAEGAEVEVAYDTYQLLHSAQYYCAESEGAFDITIGPVVRLWDWKNENVPREDAIKEALSHVGWRNLLLREEAAAGSAPAVRAPAVRAPAVRVPAACVPAGSAPDGSAPDGCVPDGSVPDGCAPGVQQRYYARLEDPKASVDLGGIAKGYIADNAAWYLEARGLGAFIINLGGNVVAKGTKPGGVPWRIGLRNPKDKTGVLGAVDVSNASAVTSGIYERCFTKDGVLYHHILDAKTGTPTNTDIAGVTVIAEKSMDAEGFSTTLLALGTERGITFARSKSAIKKAVFVTRDGRIITSDEKTT